jgi:lactoylglutathione lyase
MCPEMVCEFYLFMGEMIHELYLLTEIANLHIVASAMDRIPGKDRRGNMKIEHMAIWTGDIERLRTFYETYFDATPSARYVNAAKQFESCFLSFPEGARLEIMHSPQIHPRAQEDPARTGYAHLAFSMGSREQVDALTSRLQNDGYRLLDGPRVTGDGYYESLFLDPDGNRIEITI